MAATLPRELIKWLQSLDLTWPVKNAKWDLANGYLVAEIFSWYYPEEIDIQRFLNASQLNLKMGNWKILKQFIKKKNIPIPEEFADAVMHCKDGAAVLFIQTLYELLTNRQLKVIAADPEIDFTDHGYQRQLPDHARSTALQAIRNNLKGSELVLEPNINTRRLMAQNIINRHTEDRAAARLNDPKRFGHRPTIGELAIRRPPPPEHTYSSCTDEAQVGQQQQQQAMDTEPSRDAESDSSVRGSAVRFQDCRMNTI